MQLFGEIPGMLVHYFQISLIYFVCLSVCQLVHFLTEIIQIQGYHQFWIIYLSKFFWTHSWDVGTLFLNDASFLVCVSVFQLAYFVTEIRQIQGYLQLWMRYLPEIFSTHSLDVSTLFLNDLEFLVCLSVYQLAYFLTVIDKQGDNSSSNWNFFHHLFGDFPWQIGHFSDNFRLTFCFSGGSASESSGPVCVDLWSVTWIRNVLHVMLSGSIVTLSRKMKIVRTGIYLKIGYAWFYDLYLS